MGRISCSLKKFGINSFEELVFELFNVGRFHDQTFF